MFIFDMSIWSGVPIKTRSSRFFDLAALNARRTHAHAPRRLVKQNANGLQIQVPPAIRYIMGVADLVPKLRAPAADFTYSCHFQIVARAVGHPQTPARGYTLKMKKCYTI